MQQPLASLAGEFPEGKPAAQHGDCVGDAGAGEPWRLAKPLLTQYLAGLVRDAVQRLHGGVTAGLEGLHLRAVARRLARQQ